MGRERLVKYLFYLCFLAWPFGLLLSIGVPQFSQPIYLLDIVVGITVLTFLSNKNNRQEIKSSFLFRPLTIFFLTLVVSFLVNYFRLSGSENITAGLYLARIFCYPVLFFVANKQNQKDLLTISTFSFALFLLLAIFQYLFIPDMRFLKLLGFDDHYYRLMGSMFDPNFTGAIIAGGAILALYVNQLPLFFVSLIALALTFSRASYLSFGVGLVLFSFYYKKTKLLILFALLGIIIYFIPKPFGEGVNLFRTFSIFSRVNNWGTSLSLFFQEPILGNGFKKVFIDNSFIYLLVSSGLAGLAGFIYLLRSIFQKIDPINKILLIVLITHSMFNNSLFFVWIYFIFWVSLSLKFKGYKSP